MGLGNLKDYLKKDGEKFVDRARFLSEEGVDIALDKWDTIKKTDPRILGAIGGGIVLIVLIIVLVASRPPAIPIIAKRDITGVLGYSFVIVENESQEDMENIVLILDDSYIYRIPQLGPLQELSIKTGDFHKLVGNMQMGDTVEQDIKPSKMKISCDLGDKVIDLAGHKKTFMEKLLGK